MFDSKKNFSRRQFVAGSSCFGALCAFAKFVPLSALAEQLVKDSRVSAAPLADKGFASVRQIGEGVYATIANPPKGMQATCNGGFLVGKDAAFLVEGFNSPAGASFQMDALRLVSRVPLMAALDTHYHYDHSMGNSFYGGIGVPLWAHASTAKRLVETYGAMQGAGREAVLAPYEKHVRGAKSDVERAHAQTDVDAMTEVFTSANGSMLGLPSHPLDPAKLPMKADLGGVTALLEYHSGHSGTDIVVRVPEQNVVFMGDLLFNGKYPVCFDEQVTLSGWRKTLKYFGALDKDTLFVPGHGQVCGQEGIAAMLAVFDDISEQAEKMYRAGVPVGEAKHRYVVPNKYRGLPIWSWDFTIGSAIANLYSEWKTGGST